MTTNFDGAARPVCAHTKRDFTVLVGILALIGVGISIATVYTSITSPRPDNTPAWAVAIVSLVIFVSPNLVALWIFRRLRLVADETGLQIRSAFATQFIPWRALEDYELRPSPNNAATARLSWICHNGKWQRLPQLLANMDALRARIQAEATHSRAQKWQLNVERDDADNWPKTYAYRDPSGRLSFAFFVALLSLYFGFMISGGFSLSSVEAVRETWAALDPWDRVRLVLVPLPAGALATLLLLPHYAILRAKKRLGRQIIRADQNALTLVDGAAQTRIAWPQITDYFFEDASGPLTLHQCVVESATARLVFRQEISDSSELKVLIRARAVNAASGDWRARESADTDTIGGAQSLWSGGTVGVGRKIYHYRTRTMRAILGLNVFFVLTFVFGYGAKLQRQPPESGDLAIVLIIFAPLAALAICGAIAFWRASIQTDESGILHRSIWGERRLRWDEIESFIFYGYFYQIKGGKTTILYGAVAAGESLRAEIEARTGLKMNRTDRSNDDE